MNFHVPRIRGAEIIEKARKTYPELNEILPEKKQTEEPVRKEEPMSEEISLEDFIKMYDGTTIKPLSLFGD